MTKSFSFLKKKPQFKNSGTVLLSSSFLMLMRISGKTYQHHVSKLLGRKVTFVTTRCAIKDTDFANQVYDLFLMNMKISIKSCSQGAKCSELQCLMHSVGGGNGGGLFVATNDDSYVEQLQQMDMVPIISFNGNKMFVREPSDKQEKIDNGTHRPGNHIAGRRGGREAGQGGGPARG